MAMVWTLGYFTARRRLAVAIFAVMLALYLPMVAVAVSQEAAGNPAINSMRLIECSSKRICPS